MAILIGILLALTGGLAELAGLQALRRARRLRRNGEPAWAMAMSPAAAPGEQPGGSPHRILLQYQPADGGVLELSLPAPARKAAALSPGQQVLVWYDPENPRDVLVYGRDGRLADSVFVAAGTLVMLAGAAVHPFIRRPPLEHGCH